MPTEEKSFTSERKAFEKGADYFYHTMKHLTTLSTGAIIILATFLEKVFMNPTWKCLIAITLVSFLISILFAVFSMMYVSDVISKINKKIMICLCITYSISGISFIVGISCLVIFTIHNFY